MMTVNQAFAKYIAGAWTWAQYVAFRDQREPREQYQRAQHAMRYLSTYYSDIETSHGHEYFLRKIAQLPISVLDAAYKGMSHG